MYDNAKWEYDMLLNEISQTKLALGSDVSLTIVTDMDINDVKKLFDQLWEKVFIFERRFSRFLPMSELSLFNRSTGLNTPITSEFKDLLVNAKRLGSETEGLYNPFILPALQKTGYIKSAASGYQNDSQIDYTNRRVVDIDRLVIEDNSAQIPYGTAIDLGGCGKGYLADQLGQILQNKSDQGYWLSLGGDIVTMGYDKLGQPINLNIQDANDLSSTTNWIIGCPIEHFAVATSGTFKRIGQDNKKDWHHIIDPLTQKPAETDIRLATVCADTAIKADVLASCAVILGSKVAIRFLKAQGVKSAILQCVDENGVFFEKVFGKNIKENKLYSNRVRTFQNA